MQLQLCLQQTQQQYTTTVQKCSKAARPLPHETLTLTLNPNHCLMKNRAKMQARDSQLTPN